MAGEDPSPARCRLLAFISKVDADYTEPDYPRDMLVSEIAELRGIIEQASRHSLVYLANEATFERIGRHDAELRVDGWLKWARKLAGVDKSCRLNEVRAIIESRVEEPTP